MTQLPQQERSRQALRRLYEATAELLAERTFDGISVKEIAAAARVSVGSVYQRFENKDALLLALNDHYVSEAGREVERLAGELAAAEEPVRIEAVVQLMVSLFSRWRGVIRSMHLRQLVGQNTLPPSDLQRIDSVYKRLVSLISGERANRKTVDRSKLIVVTVLGLCRERFVFGDFESLRFAGTERQFTNRLIVVAEAIPSA